MAARVSKCGSVIWQEQCYNHQRLLSSVPPGGLFPRQRSNPPPRCQSSFGVNTPDTVRFHWIEAAHRCHRIRSSVCSSQHCPDCQPRLALLDSLIDVAGGGDVMRWWGSSSVLGRPDPHQERVATAQGEGKSEGRASGERVFRRRRQRGAGELDVAPGACAAAGDFARDEAPPPVQGASSCPKPRPS